MLREIRKTDSVAMRDAYCEALIALAEDDPSIIAVEADLMTSMGTAAFAERFPNRSINCGLQEANAVGVASALSIQGFIPFFHTFGVFATRRVFDQVFLSCGYANANVKIVGGDAGITAAANGGTHMPFEDLCLMRAVPGMTVVEPADTVALRAVVPQISRRVGNCYMRFCRRQVVRVYDDGTQFILGRANTVREGMDATIIACGILLDESLAAAEMLESEGISVRVVDHFTVKPIDRDCVSESAAKTGAIVTAENHGVIGGLGSAIAEFLSETLPTPIERIGVRESYGEVGDMPYLMKRFSLTALDIAAAVHKVILRKRT